MDNKELIRRARELDAMATPGPWWAGRGAAYKVADLSLGPDAVLCQDDGPRALLQMNYHFANYRNDSAFIAEARELVPALATALETAPHTPICGHCDEVFADRAAVNKHIGECDKNPLVERIRDLEAQLAGYKFATAEQLADARLAGHGDGQRECRAEIERLEAYVEQARPVVEAVRAWRRPIIKTTALTVPLMTLTLPPEVPK